MSHIVIHDDRDGVTEYRQFDDLEASVAHLETLHNVENIDNARLFTLEEVEFEVKSYIRVEIGSSAPEPASVVPVPVEESEVLPAAESVEHVETASPIETMETSSIPAHDDTVAEPVTAGGQPEVRRGLFGR